MKSISKYHKEQIQQESPCFSGHANMYSRISKEIFFYKLTMKEIALINLASISCFEV
jgi:hypothetical protein